MQRRDVNTEDKAGTNLSSLDQFIDEVDRMVAVVWLTHHLSDAVRTDSVIWTTKTRDTKGFYGCIRSYFECFQYNELCKSLEMES